MTVVPTGVSSSITTPWIVTDPMTENLDIVKVNEIRSKLLLTNKLLGIKQRKLDYQRPIGGCDFDTENSVCSGGRARYERRPNFRWINGPMKLHSLLKVLNRASNKKLFGRVYVLQTQPVSVLSGYVFAILGILDDDFFQFFLCLPLIDKIKM